MAAATADRNTKNRSGLTRSVPIAAATLIPAGVMVAIAASTFAVNASADDTLKVIGVSNDQFDNSAGGNGDLNAEVRTGVFQFANSAAGDAITRADIGADCYAADNQTVAKTDNSGARPVAGKIFDVDADGVWVEF